MNRKINLTYRACFIIIAITALANFSKNFISFKKEGHIMISETLAKALSDQVNTEMYSAYLYLNMSACVEAEGLKGCAHWLFIQAKEEMAHAMHIYQYVLDRGAVPAFSAIEQPPSDFAGVKEIFDRVYAHERVITKCINNIATLAMKESDHACYQFIMWYVNEQVDEESTASDMVTKLKFIDGNTGLLLNFDADLGARVYVNPFPTDVKQIL